jgi:hypothetical protein
MRKKYGEGIKGRKKKKKKEEAMWIEANNKLT